MSGFGLFLMILTWTVFFCCVGFCAFAFVEEARWAGRAKINYRNFETLAKYFNFKPRKFIYPLYGASVLLSVGVIIAIHFYGLYAESDFVQLRILNFTAIFSVALTTVGVFISVSKSGKNKNLSPIRPLRLEIQESFSNQEQLEESLEKFRGIREKFLKGHREITARFDGITAKKGEIGLDATLSDLDALIQDCEGRLRGFDNSLTDKFDAVLAGFLKFGRAATESIGAFRLNDLADIEPIRQKADERQKEVIAAYVMSIAKDRNYANDGSIAALYSLADDQKITYTGDFIVDSFAYLDTHAKSRAEVVPKALSFAAVDAQIYASFVYEGRYFWLLEFEYDVPQTLNVKIAEGLLDADAGEFVITFLARLKDGAAGVLRAAVAVKKEDNKTRRQFVLYIDIAAGSPHIGGSRAKASEDLYAALSNFARVFNRADIAAELSAVKAANNFNADKPVLARLYTGTAAGYDGFFRTSLLILMQFLSGGGASGPYDRDEVIRLFHEYKYTLGIIELQVLNLILIASLFIYESQDAAVRQTAGLLDAQQRFFRQNANALGGISSAYAALGGTLAAARAKEQKAAAIVRCLTVGDYAAVSLNIVNRIERERSLYPKFAAYNGGGSL
ncbi:MAG: hypothetical protein LBL66_09540 [Clostridiales bacterium]|jgi:hypothetical protein|nr:hypothetical protein [Clostridiales bacterium]